MCFESQYLDLPHRQDEANGKMYGITVFSLFCGPLLKQMKPAGYCTAYVKCMQRVKSQHVPGRMHACCNNDCKSGLKSNIFMLGVVGLNTTLFWSGWISRNFSIRPNSFLPAYKAGLAPLTSAIFQPAPHMQVVILNYCRALQPKSLGLLVDHARDLHRLEIYGEERPTP